MKLAILGGGKMGEAFVAGLLESAIVDPPDVQVAEVVATRRDELAARYGVAPVSSPADAVPGAKAAIVAVKPGDVSECLTGAHDALDPETLVISIAAGVAIATLEALLPPGQPVVRAMPNLGATVRAGVTAYAPGSAAGEDQMIEAGRILSAVGPAVAVAEKDLDAVTALSGSGPAYVFLLAEAMEASGREAGLDPDVAALLTVRTLLGGARLLVELGPLEEGGMRADEWRAAVTSKGGTTEAAMSVLEEGDFRELVGRAIEAARRRSIELREDAGPSVNRDT